MSTRTLSMLALTATVLFGARASANNVDYSASPIVDWSMENKMLDQCTAMGKLGTPACSYDEASFNKHYQQHKQRKPNDRDRAYPHDYCQGAVSMLNGNQASSNFFHELASDAPAKAFSSRVQSIVCVYDDSAGSPSLKLVKSTLVITLRWNTFEDPTGLVDSGSWYIRDLAAIFPEFKSVWHAKHPNDRL
jgi:hypothetical protein